MADSTPKTISGAVQGQPRVLLSDVLNRILDKGVMVAGSVTIAVADIDLVKLDLTLLLSAIETVVQNTLDRQLETPPPTPVAASAPHPSATPPVAS